MTNLERKLTALEQIAEEARRRQLLDEMREVIVRRARANGWKLTPAELERDVTRAVETALRVEDWLSEGLSIEEAARLLAHDLGLNPERVVELYQEIKAESIG